MCLYRDGRDSVAWHGDRIGRGRSSDTMVAIVSFGSPRPLMLRPSGGGESLRFPLGHGDLVVMGGSCQRTWEHCIPKTTKPVGPARQRAVPARRGRLTRAPTLPRARSGPALRGARDPPAETLRARVLFSMRRADRKVRRTSPPSGEPLETGVVLDIQPGTKPGRVELLRVRSLRTQQRAESQCQVIPRAPGLRGSGLGFLWLIDIESANSRFSAAIKSSTESLILAQDERWRRA